MNSASADGLGILAKLTIALGLVLIIGGIAWHGVTLETLQRVWDNLIDRPTAKMSFRFALQPAAAIIVGIRDGVKDAHANRTPYFWAILTKSDKRIGRLREGINSTARILLLAIAIDIVYQAIVLGAFYPNEAVIVALLLAFVPYLLVRGLATRMTIKRFY